MFIREGNIYMASEALNVWAGIHILHIMVKQKTPDTCGYTCRKQQLVASWTKNTVQEGTWRNLKLNRHTKIYFRRLSSGVFDLNKKWGGCCCEQGKQDECRTWGIWLFMKNLQAVLLSFGNKLWSNTKNRSAMALMCGLNVVISKSVLNISVVISPQCRYVRFTKIRAPPAYCAGVAKSTEDW